MTAQAKSGPEAALERVKKENAQLLEDMRLYRETFICAAVAARSYLKDPRTFAQAMARIQTLTFGGGET